MKLSQFASKHTCVLLVIFLFYSNSLLSQTTNFSSLLWKISGNGLEKPSYLYGTMHVSKKVAFHLTEAFFEGLKSAEVVALESNPETWLDELMSESANALKANAFKKYLPNYNQNFYEDAFSFYIPTDKNIQYQISKEPENVNGLLYRFSGYSGNFEEETYLDLFIMQAAKKSGKKIASLEDYKTSMEMVAKASLPDDEKNKDKTPKKYYSPYEIWEKVENAYRKGDLDELDSLQKLTYTKNFEKYMLIERNKIMVKNMDSLMKKQIVFAAIGAAHLPGKEGAINMLRSMGYTVEPVLSEVSKTSIKQMNKFGEVHTVLNFKTRFLADSTVKVDAPGKMYEMNGNPSVYECLYTDMVNGSYYDMRRIKIYGLLLEQNAAFQLDRIDKMLYESIPGKIISKKSIKANDGSQGFDIVNKTARGDYQRYNIFVTDEFLYLFKVNGPGDYVKSSEIDAFFKSIKFINKNVSPEWKSFQPTYGGYEISVPGNYQYEKLKSSSNQIDKITASEGSNSYFFNRSVLNDYEYIEEDTFELNQLSKKFYEPLDYKLKSTQFNTYNSYPSIDIVTKHKTNGSNLFIKIVIKDAQYFLLACKTNEANPSVNYFSSLKFKEYSYDPFELYQDTLMHFSVKTDYKQAKLSSLEKLVAQYSYYGSKLKSPPPYLASKEEKVFESAVTSESVKVEYYKSSDYEMQKSMDKIWADQIDLYKAYTSLRISKKVIYEKNKIPTMDFMLSDTNTIRAVRVRMMYKPGVLYTLSVLTDTLSQPSAWVNSFFDTFQPKDTVLAKSVLSDKIPDFFADLASADSTTKEKVVALYNAIDFQDKDAEQLMKFISGEKFSLVNSNVKSSLIYSLGTLKDPKIILFLKKEYPKYIDSVSLQLDVLNALLRQKTKEGNLAFVELLKVETPLTDNDYLIQSVFLTLYDSMEIAKVLYPSLFEMTKYPEYKNNVYSLLGSLLDSALISSQFYLEQKKEILRFANDELKRQIASEESIANNTTSATYDYSSDAAAAEAAVKKAMDELYRAAASGANSDYSSPVSFQTNWSLLNYYDLLAPFYSEPAVKASFDKAFKSKNAEFKIELCAILIQKNIAVADTTINGFAKDPKTRSQLYYTFNRIKKLNRINSEFRSQNSLSYSYLYGYDEEASKADSIEFIGSEYVVSRNKEGYVYFYKSQSKETGQKYIDYAGFQPKDSTKVEAYPVVSSRRTELDATKTIEETIKDICYNLSLRGRKRVVVKNDYYNNLYGNY